MKLLMGWNVDADMMDATASNEEEVWSSKILFRAMMDLMEGKLAAAASGASRFDWRGTNRELEMNVRRLLGAGTRKLPLPPGGRISSGI
jgi:hypothetical protein